MTSSIDFGTIASEPDNWNDFDLMDADAKATERHRKEAVRKKQQTTSAGGGGGGASEAEMFAAAYWQCVRSHTIIDRKDEGRIINHKSVCPYCTKHREEQEVLTQARIDGGLMMSYILCKIQDAKREIEEAERKIKSEQEQKRESWEIEVRMAEYQIREAEHVIKKELIEKHKLLNHENELTRNAAAELYNVYLKLPESQRKKGPNYWK